MISMRDGFRNHVELCGPFLDGSLANKIGREIRESIARVPEAAAILTLSALDLLTERPHGKIRNGGDIVPRRESVFLSLTALSSGSVL